MILDIPTDTSPVNTNSVPVDFSASPDIRASPVTEALQVSTQCGDDFICDSDLQLKIANVIYRYICLYMIIALIGIIDIHVHYVSLVICQYDNTLYLFLFLPIVIIRKTDPSQLSSDQSQVVIGDTSFVDLIVSLTNVEEDAFNSYLVFNLTNTYFSSATSPNVRTSNI